MHSPVTSAPASDKHASTKACQLASGIGVKGGGGEGGDGGGGKGGGLGGGGLGGLGGGGLGGLGGGGLGGLGGLGGGGLGGLGGLGGGGLGGLGGGLGGLGGGGLGGWKKISTFASSATNAARKSAFSALRSAFDSATSLVKLSIFANIVANRSPTSTLSSSFPKNNFSRH